LSNTLTPEKQNIPIVDPNDLPESLIERATLVLPQTLIFPHTIIPLTLEDSANRRAVEYALANQQSLFISHKKITTELRQAITITEIRVLNRSEEEGVLHILVQGIQRVDVRQVQKSKPFFITTALPLTEVNTRGGKLKELTGLFRQLVMLNENIPTTVADFILTIDDASRLTDSIASSLHLPYNTQVQLLGQLTVDKRVEQLINILLNELNTLETHNDLNNQVQTDLARSQREAYLREQLRVIQGELGEGDPFQQEMSLLHGQIVQAKMPAEVQAKALNELARLGMMAPMSPESGIIRTYIQWLIDVPWANTSKDKLNLASAEKVLKKAHHGLEKVKERILEHIAVRKLAGAKMKSPILCFVGPPGVGKTSLGKSIAEALGREFVRVSLGGVRDEAEIRGHRRTYIGALPGRIIQTLKQAGTTNPIFMLDEIDKMSDDYRGDPAAALLEVLDPEQNSAFSDHYLEVPYDLSQVLFITTANDLDPLPEALEDRMEIIEFRAYTEEEKVEIARLFLIPKALQAHGLSRRGIRFQNDALQMLIRQYTLEAGVRNLEREIANICRKMARQVATQKPYPKRITAPLVEKYLGAPYILESRVNRDDSVGLVTGLVWSPSGGDTQIIEVSLLAGKGSLTLTGQLGDVLQESAQAALSYMRSKAYVLGIPVEDFEDYDVHIHLPEGGVPKDGPSAGIALATGIISAFTEQKVRADTAMTGEITLRGYVLPVGGIKEKVLAARRRKIPNIILPADNRKDLVDIPKAALRDVNIIFVKHMEEVMNLVLLDAPTERQRDIEAAEREDDKETES
jgi:ATP-dependent Lon protease